MYQSGTDQGKRSIVLDAACDEDVWIWHWNVGAPCSCNDINVLHECPLFLAATSGAWPPELEYTVHNRTLNLPYYLADGLYPRYAFMVTPFPQPTRTMKQRTFIRLQEALGNDVERLYGVITARFHNAPHPARYGTVQQLTTTAKAISILHNIAVEACREGFTGRLRSTAAALARAADLTCEVVVEPAAIAAVGEAPSGAAGDACNE